MNPEYLNLIVIGIVAMFYVLYRSTRWTDNPSKFRLWVGRILVIIGVVALVLVSEHAENPEYSLGKLFLTVSTSPILTTIIAVVVLTVKFPTRDDLNNLRDDFKELRSDFRSHIEKHH